jgi:hypothetical protein
MQITETEAGFQEALRQYALLHGWQYYHIHDARCSPAGFPDVVLARPGDALILAELKSARGRVRPEQQEWYDVLRQCTGIENYIWRPGDWDWIAQYLGRRPYAPHPPR